MFNARAADGVNTVLTVLEGGCDGAELECQDEGDAGEAEQVRLTLAAGETVALIIDGAFVGCGEYDLDIYRVINNVTPLVAAETRQGSIEFVGNAVSIGRYVTDFGRLEINSCRTYSDGEGGTTDDWTLNAGTADLAFPEEASVYRAFLVWGGDLDSDTGERSAQPVLFTPPGGAEVEVAPDAFGIDGNYYSAYAEVTDLLGPAPSGEYRVGRIWGGCGYSNAGGAGWTLAVVYDDLTEPYRNLGLFFDSRQARDGSPTEIISIPGLCTPSTGDVSATVHVAAAEGDEELLDDYFLVGDDTVTIGGDIYVARSNVGGGNVARRDAARVGEPDRDEDNFFVGFNDGAVTPPNEDPEDSSTGWDTANVDASGNLPNYTGSLVTALFQGGTDDDLYNVAAIGTEIVLGRPIYDSESLSGSVSGAEFLLVGESALVTALLVNEGSESSTDVRVSVDLDDALIIDPSAETLAYRCTSGSGELPITAATLEAGVDIPVDIAPGDRCEFDFSVLAVSLPARRGVA